MDNALKNLFAVTDLRNRVLFTLALLGVYRVGGVIPTPGVNTEALALLAEQTRNTMFGLYNMFSGNNLAQMTIFALGVMPYISASIILQLLTVVWPALERISKEGELGRRKITQWTRYLTVGLALMQSFGIAMMLQNSEGGFVMNPGFGFVAMTMLSLTTGTAFIMWLGEQISERGIGNGISLIIFAGIVVGLIPAIGTTVQSVRQGNLQLYALIPLLAFMVLVVAFIVYMERAQRRIPVQYAKRMVGRRMYGGTSTYLPMKVNQAGVIPIIFASSLLYLPDLITRLIGDTNSWWSRSSP